MFAANGTLLRCSCKSALFGILVKLRMNLNEDNNSAVNQSTQVHMRVAVVDAAKLLSHIFKTFSENKGVRLVFGRYSLPSSLKRDTWTKGQKGKEAQKTIKAGQQNRGWVVVVGGQNAWEQEKIFLAPKQTRGGRCRDYFTCHGCYSQSYDILSTQRFTSWLSDIIQVFASTPFVTSTWRNHQEIILWEKKENGANLLVGIWCWENKNKLVEWKVLIDTMGLSELPRRREKPQTAVYCLEYFGRCRCLGTGFDVSLSYVLYFVKVFL